jgi:hypothetical protein
MRIKTTPGRNAPAHETAEFAIDGHPGMLLVRRPCPDGKGGQATADHVRLAGTGLTVKVSPFESINDACARLRAGLDRLAAAVVS